MKYTLYFISFFILFFSCNKENLLSADVDVDKALVSNLIKKYGGETNVLKVNYVKFDVEGSTFEWEQPIPEEQNPLNGSNYKAKIITSLNNRQLRVVFDFIQYNHPFDYKVENGLLIVDDKKGTISGGYDWSSFYYENTSPRPMHSSMIESLLKNNKMANPLGLLKEYIENDKVLIKDNNLLYPLGVDGLHIELKINKTSGLPEKSSVLEADNLQGDVLFEVFYDSWEQVGEYIFPKSISYKLNGEIIRKETIYNIEINPEIKPDFFTTLPVKTQVSYDLKNAKLGLLFSQWYHRWTAWGIRMDDPLDNGAIVLDMFDLSLFGLQSQEIGPDVRIIGRPDNRTWAVAINTPEGIVIFDAPVNPFWMSSLIDAAKRAFPNKNISAVIISHTHHVFLGGIREVAPLCDNVYVGSKGKINVEKAFSGSHKLYPDKLALNNKKPKVFDVNKVIKMHDFEIHPLKNNYESNYLSGQHSEDMLIVYIPKYKTILQSDMIWTGEFLSIWDGKSSKGYTPKTKAELQKRARYLLDYIEENNLDVEKIVAGHGGVCSINDLKKLTK